MRSLGHRAGREALAQGPGADVSGAWGLVMAKVYLSSTIADLKPERQAVLDWLRLARHQAIDSYLPDSDTVRESCLDPVFAHGISLREPAGPADVDFEEVE